jgi:hypothetical protein
VVAIVVWSIVMYLLWGTWLEPNAGLMLCPEGVPDCHDVERPPFALWWIAGLIVILGVAWIVRRRSIGRS